MQRYNGSATRQRRNTQYSSQSRSSPAGKYSYWNDSSPKIHDIDATEVYSKIKRPLLTPQKTKKLTDQLAVEKQAYDKYQARIKEKNLIVPFLMNPLTRDIEGMKQNQSRKKKKLLFNQINNKQPETQRQRSRFLSDRSKEKEKNLIAQIEKIRKSKGVFGREMKNGLGNLILEKQKISSNLSNCIPSNYKSISPKKKNHNRSTTDDKKKDLIIRHFSQEMEIENILNIQQVSFYSKRIKIQNIFNLIFKKKYQIKMGHPFIDRYNFCHESNRQIVQKLKVPIFRDISQFSRSLIKSIKPKQNKLNFLEAKEMNFDDDKIDFDFLLSVGSGRVTSFDIAAKQGEGNIKRGNAARDQNLTLSEFLQQQIDYPSNTENIGCNSFRADFEVQQNFLFHSIEKSHEEKAYELDMQRQLLEFTATFKEEGVKQNLKIRDIKLNEVIQEKKKMQSNTMIDNQNREIDDIDRLIRRNKQKKDRQEEIRIKALIAAVKLSKEFQSKFKKEKKPSLSPSPKRQQQSTRK